MITSQMREAERLTLDEVMMRGIPLKSFLDTRVAPQVCVRLELSLKLHAGPGCVPVNWQHQELQAEPTQPVSQRASYDSAESHL